MSVAGAPSVADLFNAGLADDRDLRSLFRPSPVPARWPARRRRPNTGQSGEARTPARASRGPARARGASERGLLVVLDGSEAARHAVDYVGKLVGRHQGFRVCVAHVLPELPSDLLEHGGAGDPRLEERLESKLRAEQRRWIAARKREARRALGDAVASLRRTGLRPSAVTTRFCGPASEAGVADEILRLARTQKCLTVVIGRRRLSWLDHLFDVDLRADLARRGGAIAIWGIA